MRALADDSLASSPVGTIDLDEGLEDALVDFDPPSTPGRSESPPVAERTVDALELDEAFEAPDLEPAPALEVEPALEFEPAEALDAAEFDGGEPLELAEAELTPLEAGDGDVLDDAFVELIEE